MWRFVVWLLPVDIIPSKDKKAQCLCVSQCLCSCTCVMERLRETLSKLIRWGIRMEVKYWATCNERRREGRGASRGQAHTKQWSSGNLVLIFTRLGMKVDGGRELRRETVSPREGERGRESTKGLVSCQLDSLTPFGGEQTNGGISWADSVDLS